MKQQTALNIEKMTETTVDRKLFEIFDEAFQLYNSFETSSESTNSPEFQVNTFKKFCVL